MSNAAELLERLGQPGALRLGAHPLPRDRRLSSGIPVLDELLDGGFPRGKISELSGPCGTGRTSLLAQLLASLTARGELGSWIDPGDHLDPDHMLRSGGVLSRVLWIRPPRSIDALKSAEIVLDAGGFGLVALDLPDDVPVPTPPAWMRLARACERTGSALLVVDSVRRVGSAAALGLACTRHQVRWAMGLGRRRLFDGFESTVTVVRDRAGRLGRSVVMSSRAAA